MLVQFEQNGPNYTKFDLFDKKKKKKRKRKEKRKEFTIFEKVLTLFGKTFCDWNNSSLF